MRGSATHNEECREKVESYLRRSKNKRMAAHEENMTERFVRFTEAQTKKQKTDSFVEAEIVGDEDVPIDEDVVIDEDETFIGELPLEPLARPSSVT